ncbi:MAG: DUF115 domain-containing protein [Lachnospiraceae bacterium]|nr:DUF115 domain-containing protein [Lachnospiraceae bacterium]
MADETLLYFVFGFGNGDYAESLLARTSSVVKLIIYEPETTVFMNTYDEERLSRMLSDGRLMLVLRDEEQPDELEKLLDESIQAYNAEHIATVILPGYKTAYENEYERIRQVITQTVKERMNDKAGMMLHAELPCKNELYALSALADNTGCNKMFEAFSDRDMPVFIVSAGPSLDRNADELKRAYKKALIIVVSRASLLLDDRKIKADLVAQLDPKNDGFLDHDREGIHRILISSRGDIEIQKKYRGKCIYYDFSDDLPGMGDVLKAMPVIEEHGGSVATYVFSLFLSYGFRHIILVGQDLAFGADESTYARGDNRNTGSKEVEALVPGINGGQVKTRHDWLSFLRFFEAQIEKHPEAEVVDATEGGALIRGSRVMSLREAVDRYCTKEYPTEEILAGLTPFIQKEEAVKLRMKMLAIAEELKETEADIRKFSAIGRRILSNRDKVSASDMRSYDSLYHRILDSRAGNILIYYCEDIMQDYINNAVCFEASGDERTKVRVEVETFDAMMKKIPELYEYMKSIYGES